MENAMQNKLSTLIGRRTFTRMMLIAGMGTLAGCSSDKGKLTGRWESIVNEMTFFDDGKGAFTLKNGSLKDKPFTWALVGEGQLRIEVQLVRARTLVGSFSFVSGGDGVELSGFEYDVFNGLYRKLA